MPGEIALRNAEHNAVALSEPTFNYSGSGRPNSSDKSPKGKTGAFLNGKKKGLATILIVVMLGIGGGFLTNMSTILPGTLVNNLTNQTDYQYTPGIISLNRILAGMTSGKSYDNSGNKSWTKKYGELTDWVKVRFDKNGIETDGNSLSWNGQNASGSDFVSLYNNNAEFRSDVTDATFGRAANYYDTPAETTFANLGGRNVLSNYKNTGDSEADLKQFQEISAKRLDNQTSNAINSQAHTKEDEDGDLLYKIENKEETANSTLSTKQSSAEALSAAGSYISNLSQNVSKYVGLGCTVLNTGHTIASVIAGMKLYSAIKNFLTVMESPSKVIAGDGQTSGFNELANEMTKEYTVEVEDIRPASIKKNTSISFNSSNLAQQTDGEISVKESKVSLTGSVLSSPNMRAGLSYGDFDANTGSLFSIIGAGTALATALSSFNVTSSACLKAQASLSGVNLIGHTAIAIGAAAGGPITIGAAAIGSLVKETFWKLFVSLAVNVSVGAFLSFLIPTLANTLFRNPVENTFGVAAGEWVMSGAGAFGGMAGRQNSGLMPTNKENALAYSRINSQVLAMEAEVDRLNRSPFDTSSPNTFLGSLVHKFILPITTSSNKISPVNTIMSLTSSSIASLMGSVSADGEGTQYMTTFGYCPQLEEIGLTGDIYCNPIVIGSAQSPQTSIFYDEAVAANGQFTVNNSTYVDTISKNLEGCDENGDNCKIKKNSNLYKYINYCVKRTSPFGINDANILSSLQGGSMLVNSAPLISDLLSIKDGIKANEYEAWSTGKACTNTPDNPYLNENKIYASYVTEQRILDQLHAYGENKSAVAQLNEEIEAKQTEEASSLEGYIAQISGVTKEDVGMVIDIALYYEYLQNYDPETRIAMSGKTANLKLGSEVLSEIKSEHIYFENEDYITTETPVIAKAFFYTDIYADLRNRSHIA